MAKRWIGGKIKSQQPDQKPHSLIHDAPITHTILGKIKQLKPSKPESNTAQNLMLKHGK